MRNCLTILRLLPAALLLTAGCTAWESSTHAPESSLPMTPAAQAARINAAILSRKVERLRQETLYLRFRSEGELLRTALERRSVKQAAPSLDSPPDPSVPDDVRAGRSRADARDRSGAALDPERSRRATPPEPGTPGSQGTSD